ncbi:MAG TPA: hypothetical protein VGJ15_10610, partial [Pirellulales bacterium]
MRVTNWFVISASIATAIVIILLGVIIWLLSSRDIDRGSATYKADVAKATKHGVEEYKNAVYAHAAQIAVNLLSEECELYQL